MKKTKPQHKRFEETARQLECDEDEAKFNESLKRIAKATPKDPEKAPVPKQG